MLEIYELIKRIEREIGSGAKLDFFTTPKSLDIQVTWWNVDWDVEFKIKKSFTESELQGTYTHELVTRFVKVCQDAYAGRIAP